MKRKGIVCCICTKGTSNGACFTNRNRITLNTDQQGLIEALKEHFNINELVMSYDEYFHLCNICYRDFYDVDFKKGVEWRRFFEGYKKEELEDYCRENNIPGYSSMKNQELAKYIYNILNGVEKYKVKRKRKKRRSSTLTTRKKVKKENIKKEEKKIEKLELSDDDSTDVLSEGSEESEEIEEEEEQLTKKGKCFEESNILPNKENTSPNLSERISKIEKRLDFLDKIIENLKQQQNDLREELEEIKKSG